MKTITIPKRFGYPTVDITINGKEETFASGVEISVEDSVAEAIENAIALYPKQGRYLSKLAQRSNGTLLEITASDLDGVETIIDSAFRSCASVTSIEIPDSVKSIKQNAFLSCSNVRSIRFGDSSKLESIAIGAFNWCSNLSMVYLPPNPPVLENVSAFNNIKSSCTFYCKSQESLEAYKKATNWSTLTGTYSFKVESK